MTGRCFSPAAALRLADEIEQAANLVFARGQDIADYCTEESARFKRQAEAIRAAVAEEQETEPMREVMGTTLRVVRKGAA